MCGRVVYIVETNHDRDGNDLDRVRSIFEGRNQDFVTAVDEKNIIVVKEVGQNDAPEELFKTAEVIYGLFKGDRDIHVAYGTVVNEIKEVSRVLIRKRIWLWTWERFSLRIRT